MYILPNFMADSITRITENINPIFITIKQNIIQLFQRGHRQQKPAAFLPHTAFAFTMFVLLGFLQVKYQGKNESPFESNPNITSLSVVSLLLYCFFYAVEQRPKTSFSRRRCAGVAVKWCMSVVGLLSVFATASLLFPDFFRPMIFGLCFVIIAAERIQWVYLRVSREKTQSEKVVNRCKELFRPLAQFFTDHHHRRQMLPL